MTPHDQPELITVECVPGEPQPAPTRRRLSEETAKRVVGEPVFVEFTCDRDDTPPGTPSTRSRMGKPKA